MYNLYPNVMHVSRQSECFSPHRLRYEVKSLGTSKKFELSLLDLKFLKFLIFTRIKDKVNKCI